MRTSKFAAILAFLLSCGLFALDATAHPGAGIVVNEQGEVFFIHTGKGVGKIDAEGKFSYFHKVSGGGHFLAFDAQERFSGQLPRLFEKITPKGVKPALLYASGGAPFVVHSDGNLYYGSGYPGGDDKTPGGLTLTRLARDSKRTLFTPQLKEKLAELGEAINGLAIGPDGGLFVACPSAIVKLNTDGAVTRIVHPLEVDDGEVAFGDESPSPFYHLPYLRGLVIAEDETIYAAVTGKRCVIKVGADDKVETVLKSEKPWSPTGVALQGKNLYALEYSHVDKQDGWFPRVRKQTEDGKVEILVDLYEGEEGEK